MIELFGIRYKQGDQIYISTVMPMSYILDNYEVLIYRTDIYGYQRAPKLAHYKKIAKDIYNNLNSQVTPSSIILGVNNNDLSDIFTISEIEKNDDIELIRMIANSKNSSVKLRIIDGQHRVKGFEKAINDAKGDNDSEKIKKLEEYSANVIIMISEPSRRKPEVEVFTNINAKAKPLKMDLTILAEHAYDLIEQPDNVNEEKYLAVNIVELLNRGDYCKYWQNGIIVDINSNNRIGCVGFKTFYESILPICKSVCQNNNNLKNASNYAEKKKILEELANDIASKIGYCCNIVFKKWNVVKKQYIFDGEDFFDTFYNEEYYLQRTMGVTAINQLIMKSYKDTNSYSEFEEAIYMSKLTVEDWNIKGKFSGMSSLAGINKIKNAINNI